MVWLWASRIRNYLYVSGSASFHQQAKIIWKFWISASVADLWHLVKIRTGSVPLANGSGSYSGSCYFRQWLSRWQPKKNFLRFFPHYVLKLHIHHFSKIIWIRENQTHTDFTDLDPEPQHWFLQFCDFLLLFLTYLLSSKTDINGPNSKK